MTKVFPGQSADVLRPMTYKYEEAARKGAVGVMLVHQAKWRLPLGRGANSNSVKKRT